MGSHTTCCCSLLKVIPKLEVALLHIISEHRGHSNSLEASEEQQLVTEEDLGCSLGEARLPIKSLAIALLWSCEIGCSVSQPRTKS